MGRTYTIHVAIEPFKVFSVKNAPSLRSNQFFGNNSTERKCNKVLQNGCAYVALDEMCSVRCLNVPSGTGCNRRQTRNHAFTPAKPTAK